MLEKQFEIFLTEQFLKLNEKKLQHGYRYQFQSPDNKNSQRLYNAFIQKCDDQLTVKNTTIRALKCGNTKLLPVLHSENDIGYSENFISHLRDEVAGQQGDFKGCALLVIHNSMLDTLINSAEDIAQDNSVWHPEKIKDALKSLIDPNAKDRKVSECLLDHRFSQIVDDGATMFGFEELYKAILDGDLKFHELGLLDDPEILNWSGKPEQINNRLEENKKLFDRINTVTERFSTELEEKFAENDFSDKFVAKHFNDEKLESWKTKLTFADCLNEKKNNVSNVLELESIDSQQIDRLAKKSKSDSKAGKREQHIILPLQQGLQSFDLSLTFLGGKVEKNQLTLQHTKDPSIEIQPPNNSGGKRSKVTVTGAFTGEPTYFSLVLKRDKTAECYKFRVLVLTADSFYLPSFENIFLIEPNKKRITLQTEDNSFVIAEQGNKAKLEQSGQLFDNQEIKEIDFELLANESNDVVFEVTSPAGSLAFNVEGAVASDSLSLPLMLDTDRFVQLFNDDYFACFNRNKNKVLLDNKEVAPKGRRLTLLQREADFLDKQLLNQHVDPQNSVELKAIEANYPEVYQSYLKLFEYCTINKTLPSLSSWGDEFRKVVSQLVDAYNQTIAEIGYDVMLTKAEKLLVNIGYAQYQENEEYREYITPFHPLVLAYHLSLAEAIVSDNINDNSSFKTLPKVTLKRLNARGLLPFLYHPKHEFAFTKLEKDNCMWLELVPHQETSYSYVRKLVKDKVTEFKDAFSSLFTAGSKATLIINSVNNHKNVELFMGLVDYVKTQKDKVCHIHVNLYDDKETRCEFDRFAETASYDELKTLYGLDKGAVREQADAIIDLLRTRLTYSKFRNDECDTKPQAYAHLSFFRNHHKVEPTDVNVLEELSGVVCHGLLAGEAADNKEESYFTAFGLKNVETKDNSHLSMAQRLNGLIKPARKTNVQHGRANSLALAVSDDFKTLLERSYDNSIWTTIIDPKVTLDFFESAKDMVLIHYSDNYTNSTNYDAITVTKETDLYKKVLEQDEGGIIEEFNAFNGEWLLKMITANSNERKEKKGIIGAYKYINCLLAKSDIIWVPLSVAEMVRVAGNIGLKMNDSDFSRNVNGYKSGAISDDVLFVGFKDNQLYLLPLEVKAGLKQTHNKGVEQAKELKRYLTEDILGRDDLAGHLYRGLFMRQILMQIDKYKLYNLYQPDYFEQLLKQREWWLQGDYQLAELQDYPEGFLVAMVENDTFFEASFKEVQNILKIQLPSASLNYLVSTPLTELMAGACSDTLSKIPEEYILLNTSHKETPTRVSDEEPSTDQDGGEVEKASFDESKVMRVQESARILIGEDITNGKGVFWEYQHPDLANRHLIIFGSSGQGKTYCIQGLLMSMFKSSIDPLVFDYTNGFLPNHLESEFKELVDPHSHVLCHKPLPMTPFRQQSQDFGGIEIKEPPHTVAGRVASVFNKVYSSIGERQLAVLNNVIECGVQRHGQKYNFQCMHDDLLEEGQIGEALASKISPLVKSNLFSSESTGGWADMLNGSQQLNIMQLASLPHDISMLATEFMLWDLYAYACSYGTKNNPIPIVLDEVQNLDHRLESPLGKMLTEGRKYGLSLVLATQTLSMLKKDEQDRLFQASHKLFFAPAKTETKTYAKILELSVSGTKQVDWEERLGELKKGECLSVGYHLNDNGELKMGVKKVKVTALQAR
ncbi:DNA phosphorothioation-dependent restriction protein DptH [Vibrio crassostreae]|uniref:DNA phosphorothioation-dependent restriction protein DptH n=2 Tax=Vibrio TaxID=662 RepID=A0AA43FZC0_VIBSP|nr:MULTISPECIES: DNA phosphorothioation-dependent restriction protein DptH [Vibrio]MDH5922720.1 DNA phosphorothioation-dependent restriction protein DptH [Vibrio splendidus]TCN02883.1 DNA phosphorothioation-dependent restriction protein DptH [Vibrio crassostreae]TCN95654.1 DNA phosphorothioation-dependent restriction protein DptH [Vibrio crassostreae]TCT46118.1 DNA phosphorothioation-dependent restriction protein DptH [Vibrio crassostreae]TCT70552.1 DNA phosphorothioation-dependent restriction